MNTVLERKDQQIAAYNEFRSQLAELEQHNNSLVFDYESSKGNKEARSHIYKLRQTKAALEKVRKAEKQDTLDYGRRVDSEAREIAGKLQAMIEVHETPIKAIEQREKDRIEQLQADISEIVGAGPYSLENWQGLPVEAMRDRLAEVEAEPITEERWQEFVAQAAQAKDKSISQIKEAITKRERYENEQAELEKLRKEAAEREQKEREERIAREAEERARKEAERKAHEEREKLKLRAEQAEREKREADERAERAAKEAAEQERREQAERERKAKEEAERREANRKHREKVHADAISALVDGGVPQDAAKEAIRLVAIGAVPRVGISY